MPDIQDYIGMSDIKGSGFNPAVDSLYQINQKTTEVSNQTIQLTTQTEMVRADTGELNGSAVLDLYVTNNLTLTGNITVNNLYVLDGATLDGNYSVTVQSSCFIYSSFIDIYRLDIKGSLYSKRQMEDTSTTCTCQATELEVLGDITIENTSIPNSVICMGTIEITDSSINVTTIPGNFTLNNSTVTGSELHVGGDFKIENGSTYSVTTTTVGGDATLSNSTYTMDASSSFKVNGSCTTTSLSCNHIHGWTVHGLLTMDTVSAGSISIEAEDFLCTATTIDCTYNLIDSAYDGTAGYVGLGYGSGCGIGGTAGIGAACKINVANTLSFPNLTSVNVTGNQGGAGQSKQSAGSGGGGGGCYLSLSANEITSGNNFTLNITGGQGGAGGANSATGGYQGGGGGGGVNATGGSGGGSSAGSYKVGGAPGGGLADTLVISSAVSFSNYTLNLVGGAGGTGGSPAGIGNTNNTPNSTALAAFSGWADQAGLSPIIPILVTANNTANPALLDFNAPIHASAINFDFAIQVERQFTEKIFQLDVSENTNDNTADFSGTAPYLQGSGTISFTLPVLSPGTYRWRVKTIKDLDTDKESLFSDWRLFTIT